MFSTVIDIVFVLLVALFYRSRAEEEEQFLLIKLAFYFYVGGLSMTLSGIVSRPMLLPAVGYLVTWLLWSRKNTKNKKVKRTLASISAIGTAISVLFTI